MRGLTATVMWTVLAGAVGVGLFFVKHEVKDQERRLAELNADIQRNQEAIHVLKAEWSYLNDPARLRALSEKYLSMKPVAPSQVADLSAINGTGPIIAALPAAKAAGQAPAAASQSGAALAHAAPTKPAAAPAAKPAAPVLAPSAIAKAEPAKKPAAAAPAPVVAKAEPAKPQPLKPSQPAMAAAHLPAVPSGNALRLPDSRPTGVPTVAHKADPVAPAAKGKTIIVQSPALAASELPRVER
jgi:hypothetical protein